MVTPPTSPEPDVRGSASPVFVVLALAWMGAIFWVSSGPVPVVVPNDLLDLLAKKAGHFGAYAVLAALWWLALRGRLVPHRALIAALAIAVGYAASDEVHQAFSPSRDPSIIDVAIDGLGAVAGVWVVAHVVRSRRRSP